MMSWPADSQVSAASVESSEQMSPMGAPAPGPVRVYYIAHFTSVQVEQLTEVTCSPYLCTLDDMAYCLYTASWSH